MGSATVTAPNLVDAEAMAIGTYDKLGILMCGEQVVLHLRR
jgi:hypothetical protein